MSLFNPIALRKAKIVYNFGLSECNRVKVLRQNFLHVTGKALTGCMNTVLVMSNCR